MLYKKLNHKIVIVVICYYKQIITMNFCAIPREIWIEILKNVIDTPEQLIDLMLSCKTVYDNIFTMKFYFYKHYDKINMILDVPTSVYNYIEYFMPNFPNINTQGKITYYVSKTHIFDSELTKKLYDKYPNQYIFKFKRTGDSIFMTLHGICEINNICNYGTDKYKINNKNLNIFTIKNHYNCISNNYNVQNNKYKINKAKYKSDEDFDFYNYSLELLRKLRKNNSIIIF